LRRRIKKLIKVRTGPIQYLMTSLRLPETRIGFRRRKSRAGTENIFAR
jgi:hypothetical protein